jgi:hypothetical protein
MLPLSFAGPQDSLGPCRLQSLMQTHPPVNSANVCGLLMAARADCESLADPSARPSMRREDKIPAKTGQGRFFQRDFVVFAMQALCFVSRCSTLGGIVVNLLSYLSEPPQFDGRENRCPTNQPSFHF